jgi:hypothetical protein
MSVPCQPPRSPPPVPAPFASTRSRAADTPDTRPATPGSPSPAAAYEDSGFDVVDTARRNVLGHGHTNTVRVFEVDDAKAVIARVLDVEWLGAVQSFHDAECRRAGIPTTVEREQARMRAARAALPAVRVAP